MFGEKLIKITAFARILHVLCISRLISFRHLLQYYTYSHLAGAEFFFQPSDTRFLGCNWENSFCILYNGKEEKQQSHAFHLFYSHSTSTRLIIFTFHSAFRHNVWDQLCFSQNYSFTRFLLLPKTNRTSCKRLTKRTAEQRYCFFFSSLSFVVGVVVIVIILLSV